MINELIISIENEIEINSNIKKFISLLMVDFKESELFFFRFFSKLYQDNQIDLEQLTFILLIELNLFLLDLYFMISDLNDLKLSNLKNISKDKIHIIILILNSIINKKMIKLIKNLNHLKIFDLSDFLNKTINNKLQIDSKIFKKEIKIKLVDFIFEFEKFKKLDCKNLIINIII